MTGMTIPANAKKVPMRPLALGEKTGHHHSLMTADPDALVDDCAELREAEDGTLYCRITNEGVLLGHQEHKTHAVPPMDFQSVRQRENTDWGARQVAD